MSIHNKLESLQRVEKKLAAKKIILLDQALHSHDPNDLIKAHTVMQQIQPRDTTVDRKAYLVDPYQFNSYMGYKDKPYSLTYGLLRRISYGVPIVRAVIGTRIDQVASFCEPQKDKYSIGFTIQKKKAYFNNADDDNSKLSKEEMQKIEEITEFILNCGRPENQYENDDFDTFVRKVLNDAMTFDQMTFDIVEDRKGEIYSYGAVDASTIRKATSIEDERYKEFGIKTVNDGLGRKAVKGYYPTHCQIKDSRPVADFYPWELCFGVRNPSTNIYSNDYGVSEIEILMNTITSMLWSDEYNRKFFSQGSAPKGLLKIKSGSAINGAALSQFRQQWQSMMSGVQNSWKTPILEGDIDWVDLQKSNNDMEFSSWQEYLIKITCAIYRIDPAEINFPLSGGAEQKAMFEGSNEARIKHSKDKGLYPLLKFLQRKLNKFVVSRLDPRFEFVFQGMDVDDPKEELDADIKMMTNFMTVDEIRIKRGLKPLGEEKGGNMIANSVIVQAQNAKAQQEMMAQQQQAGQGAEGQEGVDDEENNPETGDEGGDEDENPFTKAFENYLEKVRA